MFSSAPGLEATADSHAAGCSCPNASRPVSTDAHVGAEVGALSILLALAYGQQVFELERL